MSKEEGNTKITMVRFGNVIGSSGSAVPLFQKQIKEGGPVTVTHPEVIRYFMSIPEAAELVIQAGAMGEGGDVFVLDMGEPVNIFELAKRLIKLSGMEVIDENNPNGDIEIEFTGLRPGEKLYEELLIGDNVSTTEHTRILKAKEDYLPKEELDRFIVQIEGLANSGDTLKLKSILKDGSQASRQMMKLSMFYTYKKINNLILYTLINTIEDLKILNQELSNKPYVGVDTDLEELQKII